LGSTNSTFGPVYLPPQRFRSRSPGFVSFYRPALLNVAFYGRITIRKQAVSFVIRIISPPSHLAVYRPKTPPPQRFRSLSLNFVGFCRPVPVIIARCGRITDRIPAAGAAGFSTVPCLAECLERALAKIAECG
jgi:hypothetical protein